MLDRAVTAGPTREERRLAALRSYDVLDTEPEESFDDIVAVLAASLDVPMAAVTLIDASRQWWKAKIGMPGSSTAREVAFCNDVVATGRTVIVPDAHADPRYAANPLVLGEPKLRFYAGVPLVTPDGEVLGSLCALDTSPRELSAVQSDVLHRLARRVSDVLELRRATKALGRERALLRSTSEVSEMIAAGAPLATVLDVVARAVESRDPEVLCSILLREGDVLRDGAAPSLPASYRQRVDRLPIGPGIGCCGDAAHSGRRTQAADIATDARWAGYTDVALAADLRACWSIPMVDADGDVLGTFALYSRTPREAQPWHWELAQQWSGLAVLAVTRTREAERVRQAAVTDPLTGLPNRRALLTACEEALPDVSPGSRLAMIFLDVDNFKIVNDSLGHTVGDSFLGATAHRLRQAAGGEAVVSRFGGDEFVVLARGLTDDQDAVALAERLADAVRDPVDLGSRQVTLTFSVGVAVTATPDTSATALLRNADAALYRAKDLGRDRVALFDTALHRAALSRLELENDLRLAVHRGELHLAYQPKVELSTGAVSGAEALLRWNNPQRGQVPPSEFIGVAEDGGMVVALGSWVIREALLAHARRRDLDPAWRDVVVWVNVAPAQLTSDLPRIVRTCAEDAGLPLDRVGLEVTERSLADLPTAAGVLSELREAGVCLALDDFGTGYSSLGQLKRLPFHTLKIDKTFIDGVGNDPCDDGITMAAIGLARAHGLKVVAEGVETVGQLARLVELSCDAAQGYLFARPGPLDAVPASYADHGDLAPLLPTGRRLVPSGPAPAR